MLIKLLTEANAEIRASHKSERGQKLLRGDKLIFDENDTTNIEFDVLGNRLATTVQDPMDLDMDLKGGGSAVPPTESGRPRRNCKQPERLISTLAEIYGEDHLASVESQFRGRKRKANARSGSGTPDIDAEEEDNLLEESDDQYNPADSSDTYSDALDPSDDDLDNDGNSIVSDEADTGPALLDVMDEPVTALRLRQNYAKLSMAEQEAFNQDEMNLKQHLSLDPDHVYTIEDLENPMHLARGLQLLFQARFGQARTDIRLSPFINYDKLPVELAKAIQEKMLLNKAELK